MYPIILNSIPKNKKTKLSLSNMSASEYENYCTQAQLLYMRLQSETTETEKIIERLSELYMHYSKYCKPICTEFISSFPCFFDNLRTTIKTFRVTSVFILAFFHEDVKRKVINILNDFPGKDIYKDLENQTGEIKTIKIKEKTLQQLITELEIPASEWKKIKEIGKNDEFESIFEYISLYGVYPDKTMLKDFLKTNDKNSLKLILDGISVLNNVPKPLCYKDFVPYFVTYFLSYSFINSVSEYVDDATTEMKDSEKYYKSKDKDWEKMFIEKEKEQRISIEKKDKLLKEKEEEIARLKKQNDISIYNATVNLKKQIKELQDENNELKTALMQNETDAEELEVYRDLFEEITETIDPNYKNKLVEYFNQYKVCLIGGHDKVISKLRNTYPNLDIATYEGDGINLNTITNYDCVIINSYNLSHSVYNYVIGIIRRHNITYSYLKKRSSNLEMIEKDMFKILNSVYGDI